MSATLSSAFVAPAPRATREIETFDNDGDALAPARGLVFGLMASVGLWAVIGLAVWAVVGA